MEPIYAENVIVGVLFNEKFKWYVTERDLWFLDLNKMNSNLITQGNSMTSNMVRWGIPIVSKETAEVFLQKLIKNIVECSTLRKMLKSTREYNDIGNYVPSFFVDFDHQKFYSYFPEPNSFEKFVPDGWEGVYEFFLDRIPKSQQFWIDTNGNNLWEEKRDESK